MAGSRFVSPAQQPVQSTGLPYPGGQLFFYVSGTTGLAVTYSDSALTIPNTNPVILDSAGDAGNVFLDPTITYKVVLFDVNNNLIWTFDPVDAFVDRAYVLTLVSSTNSVRSAVPEGTDTATSSDYLIKWTYVYSGTRYQFIPAASSVVEGKILIIKDAVGIASTSPIQIAPSSGTIDSSSTFSLIVNKQAAMLVADPATNDWSVVG